LLLTILRETGTLNLSLSKWNINSNMNSNWSDQGFKVELPDSIYKNGIPAGHCYANFRDVPVELFCDDIHLGDSSDCEHVMVFIDNINYGFLYTPLFKSCHFTCTVLCADNLSIYKQFDSTTSMQSKSISGNMAITGSFDCYGFMSARSSRMEIRKHIAQQVYNEVDAHMQTLQ
jgi:hypothetical protein